MPVYLLREDLLVFPNPSDAHESGVLAVGGDLSPERLEMAYRNGIFPWFSEGEPYMWWSPEPRFVLFPEELVVRRSLRKSLKKSNFEIRFDTAFAQVINYCGTLARPDQEGTWITEDMKQAYINFHRAGYAHSVETWLDGRLVGGLYGVAIGPFFFGESMFYLESDASKAALFALAQRYKNAPFIDCQVENDFFIAMGARHIPRKRFLNTLARHLDKPDTWRRAGNKPFMLRDLF